MIIYNLRFLCYFLFRFNSRKKVEQQSTASLRNADIGSCRMTVFTKWLFRFLQKDCSDLGRICLFARPNFNKNGNGAPFPKIYEL